MEKYHYPYDDNNDIQFLDLLEATVARKKDEVFATWYNSNAAPTEKYTFRGIWDEAGQIAYDLLHSHRLCKGDRVILCYSFGFKFFAAFLGCLRAGVVGVLVYPPSPKNLSKALHKLTKIVENCDAKMVLLDEAVNFLRLTKNRKLWPNVTYKTHPRFANMKKNVRTDIEKLLKADPISSSDLAFLQYTSGSTGEPKGVMVTFGALRANVRAFSTSVYQVFKNANAPTDNIVGMTWLPQYHDMGLMVIIVPFFMGQSCNAISPFDFIKNPLLWIDLMSRVRANWSMAPNFAFRLAARKFVEAKKQSAALKEPILNLDLSSVVYLQNAAEPIQLDTKDLFYEAFGSYGLPSNWFMSGYGMAESVVYISHLHDYKLSSFEASIGLPSVAVGHRDSLPKGQEIKIVNPNTILEVGEQEVGELWITGPSVTAGYFGKSELTTERFHAKIKDCDDTFLRTGDLGFFEDDYLYICGRQKDLIIVNGVNFYPQDIENTVQACSRAIRPGCVAAFPSDEVEDGKLEVVFEIRKEYGHSASEIVNLVRVTIIEEHGIVPTKVVAIRERSILKTTSGKIQRRANRQALHSDAHNILYVYDSKNEFETLRNEVDEFDNYDSFDKIMVSFFGQTFDDKSTWDDLGLASMASVSMRDEISDSFSIILPTDAFTMFPTPAALKAFVLENQVDSLEVELNMLKGLSYDQLSWKAMGFYQALGSIALLFLFAASIVPACFFGKLLANLNTYSTIQAFGLDDSVVWFWFPVVIPMWMLSFSMIVVLLKWTVIWKYREGIVLIPSIYFLRWWFVDRLVALWEFWVGKCIVNTPLIKLFYFLMGVKLHHKVSIESFIREFDLVRIDEGSSLQSQLRCRKFGPWNKNKKPTLRFRRVHVGCHCKVKGMVSLGAVVGEGSVVKKLAVVEEGAKVPEKSIVTGNPARVTGQATLDETQSMSYMLGLLKLLWLIFELYLFFGVMLLAQYLWMFRLPTNGRYIDIIRWTLLLVWFNVSSIITGLILKWTLIGKRRSGLVTDSTWTTFVDWAVDWHFQVAATGALLSMTTHSRLWNIVLKCYGMDIDLSSKIAGVGNFLPSKVDLVKVKNSFISVATFDTKSNGRYFETTIKDSSVGLTVHFEESGSPLFISNSVVPPHSLVTSNIIQQAPDLRVFDFTLLDIVTQEILMTTGYMASFVLFFCSLIPPYEVWMNMFHNPQNVWVAVPALVCALVIQGLSWTMVLIFVQSTAMAKTRYNLLSNSLYSVYATMAFAHQNFSLLNVFHGSPLYNLIVALLGVKVKGQALLFPHRMYEYSYITIEDKTIIDSSQITGHFVVFDEITLGPCVVSGTMHEGSYAANAVIASDESVPYRAYVGRVKMDEPKLQHLDEELGNTIIDVSSHKGEKL